MGKGPAQKLAIPPGNACTVPRTVWGEFTIGRFPMLSVCGLMESFSYLHVKEGLNFTKHSLSLAFSGENVNPGVALKNIK